MISFPSPACPAIVVKWNAHDVGVFKINTDTTLREADLSVGADSIIHDDGGHVWVSSAQKFVFGFSPLMAKALAILRGLHLAVDYGLLPTVLESDAKSVVDLINSDSCSFTDIGVIVSDIVALSCRFNIPISFVPRGANKVAHDLAKFALMSTDSCFWLESCPPCLFPIILNDCSSCLVG
jgi:hypothetical protein